MKGDCFPRDLLSIFLPLIGMATSVPRFCSMADEIWTGCSLRNAEEEEGKGERGGE